MQEKEGHLAPSMDAAPSMQKIDHTLFFRELRLGPCNMEWPNELAAGLEAPESQEKRTHFSYF